jgi:hypothetical protein
MTFMTTVVARLLSDFEKLAPEEQLLVRERVISLTESIQQKAIQSLRGQARENSYFPNSWWIEPGNATVAENIALES